MEKSSIEDHGALSKLHGAGGSLPPIYLDATWRCTTPVNEQRRRIGLAFDLASGGELLRLALDIESAKNIAKSIVEYLAAAQARIGVHSDKLSGSSSVDVFPQEAEKV